MDVVMIGILNSVVLYSNTEIDEVEKRCLLSANIMLFF